MSYVVKIYKEVVNGISSKDVAITSLEEIYSQKKETLNVDSIILAINGFFDAGEIAKNGGAE